MQLKQACSVQTLSLWDAKYLHWYNLQYHKLFVWVYLASGNSKREIFKHKLFFETASSQTLRAARKLPPSNNTNTWSMDIKDTSTKTAEAIQPTRPSARQSRQYKLSDWMAKNGQIRTHYNRNTYVPLCTFTIPKGTNSQIRSKYPENTPARTLHKYTFIYSVYYFHLPICLSVCLHRKPPPAVAELGKCFGHPSGLCAVSAEGLVLCSGQNCAKWMGRLRTTWNDLEQVGTTWGVCIAYKYIQVHWIIGIVPSIFGSWYQGRRTTASWVLRPTAGTARAKGQSHRHHPWTFQNHADMH